MKGIFNTISLICVEFIGHAFFRAGSSQSFGSPYRAPGANPLFGRLIAIITQALFTLMVVVIPTTHLMIWTLPLRFSVSLRRPLSPVRFLRLFVPFALLKTHLTAKDLDQIPNQPIVFNSDPLQKRRSEDAIIAFTWAHFLNNTSQPNWLLRLPMTKAVVRAMYVITLRSSGGLLTTRQGHRPILHRQHAQRPQDH